MNQAHHQAVGRVARPILGRVGPRLAWPRTRAFRSSSPTVGADQPDIGRGRARLASRTNGASDTRRARRSIAQSASDGHRGLRLGGGRTTPVLREYPLVAVELDRLPRATTAPYGVRPDGSGPGRSFSRQALDDAGRARREGDRRRRRLDGRALARLPTPRRHARSSASSRRRVAACPDDPRPRVGVIATPATVRSHAYFEADQGREPGDRGLRARVRRRSSRSSRPAIGRPQAEAAVADRSLRSSESATPPADRSSRRPQPDRTLPPGCTHYPLLRAGHRGDVGEQVAIVDSATATASALVELLSINGLEAPGADGRRNGHARTRSATAS